MDVTDGKELYDLITNPESTKGNCFRIQELLQSKSSLWYNPDGDDPILHQAVTFNLGPDLFEKLLENLVKHNLVVVEKKNENGYSALHVAVEGEKYDHAKLLIENHANVNGKTLFLGDEPTPVENETALHLAARFKSLRCLELLLQKKAEINARNIWEETALHIAVAGNDEASLACVNLLSEHKADLKVRDRNSFTPLHIAAVTGSKENVKTLLKRGADPQEKTLRYWTPLHLAAYENNYQVVTELLTHPIDASDINVKSQTALHLAVKINCDDTNSVVELLQVGAMSKTTIEGSCEEEEEKKKVKELLDKRDMKGRTALHIAVEYGNLKIVQQLLDSGADKDIQDLGGSTPLHCALHYKNTTPGSSKDTNFIDECLKKLIFKNTKLSPNIKKYEKKSSTPLHIAAMYNYYQYITQLNNDGHINAQDEDDMTPLHIATLHGFMLFVQELIAKNANVNAVDKHGRTALYLSVAGGMRDCFEILLRNGKADVNIGTKNQMTALHRAVLNKDGAVFVARLIGLGATVDSADEEGWRPIHIAALQGNLECLKLLTEKDAEVDATLPANGFTAFHLAAQNGHRTCLEHLTEKNAQTQLKTFSDYDALSLARAYRKDDCVKFLQEVSESYAARGDPSVPFVETIELDVKSKRIIGKPSDIAVDNGQDPTYSSQILQDYENSNADEKETPSFHEQRTDPRKYVEELIARNTDINTKNTQNKTALHLAAEGGFEDLVEKVIQKGANIESKDENNSTALHLAAREGQGQCVTLLLEKIAEKTQRDFYVNLQNDEDSTALHLAIENNHYECAHILINSNADIQKLNKNRMSVLQIAAEKGHEKALEYLMGKIKTDPEKQHLATELLFRAANIGSEKCISILLKNNADTNARNNQNMTAVHIAMEKRHGECLVTLLKHGENDEQNLRMLHYAATQGYSDMINVLINSGLNIDVHGKDKDGLSALHNAAFFGHADCIEPLVKKESIDMRDDNTLTALHYAAREGKTECLEKLLDHGADVNSGDEKGATPLHMAAREEKVDCLDLLLKKNAIVDSTTQANWTPLHYAAHSGHGSCVSHLLKKGADVNMATEWKYTPLRFAAANNHDNCVTILLEHPLIEVNKKCDFNRTALHLAAMNGHNACVQLLIENKANVNGKDEYNNTPLHCAARKSSQEHGEVLKSLLTVEDVEINSRDVNGCTPLMAASKYRHINNMAILIQHGADVNCPSQDKYLYTPLHEVVSKDHRECTRLLIDSKADLNAKDSKGDTPLQLASKKGYKKLKDILEVASRQSSP